MKIEEAVEEPHLAGAALTVTLPDANTGQGRAIRMLNIGGAFALDSASANVVPKAGSAAAASFNLGEGNLAASTLRRKVNAGDWDDVAHQFLRWNKAGGTVLRGLTRRREAEVQLL